MTFVKPKKYLGQHFLKDENIAQKIVESLSLKNAYASVLEVGAGMGMLTKYLLKSPSLIDLQGKGEQLKVFVSEVDQESVEYLLHKFPELKGKIFGDVLQIDFNALPFGEGRVGLIGNFPYNISSQILFKVLEYRNQIPEVVGMFQKEVAERIASKPKNKSYGILSVLMQSFYNVEYLFEVSEQVFVPPPKVKSAVLRFTRNNITNLPCDEKLFFQVVKTAFNQRRKMLRNGLKNLIGESSSPIPFLTQRAEELTCEQFQELTLCIQNMNK